MATNVFTARYASNELPITMPLLIPDEWLKVCTDGLSGMTRRSDGRALWSLQTRDAEDVRLPDGSWGRSIRALASFPEVPTSLKTVPLKTHMTLEAVCWETSDTVANDPIDVLEIELRLTGHHFGFLMGGRERRMALDTVQMIEQSSAEAMGLPAPQFAPSRYRRIDSWLAPRPTTGVRPAGSSHGGQRRFGPSMGPPPPPAGNAGRAPRRGGADEPRVYEPESATERYNAGGFASHPMPNSLSSAWLAEVAVPFDDMPNLVRKLIADCALTLKGEPSPDGYANAELRRTVQGLSKSSIHFEVFFNWSSLHSQGSLLAWRTKVRAHPSRHAARDELSRKIAEHLGYTVEEWKRSHPPAPPVPRDPVVGPGQDAPLQYNGQLRDYSRAATWEQIRDLAAGGVLPLGRYLRFRKDAEGWPLRSDSGAELYLPEASETRSVLICAPSGSGKTQLMLRWAQAAILAGRSVLIVDVKGNVYDKLKSRLDTIPAARRPVLHRFATSTSAFATSANALKSRPVRINFLDEIDYGPGMGLAQIQRLAKAIVPDKGYTGADATYYENRLKWCAAFIGLTCLESQYCKKESRGNTSELRNHDMSDVRDLVRDQWKLCLTICRLKVRELRAQAARPPKKVHRPDVQRWFQDLALMITPTLLDQAWDTVRNEPGGQSLPLRCPLQCGQSTESFEQLTTNLDTALQAFDHDSEIYPLLSGHYKVTGGGRRLRLNELFGTQPMALIVEAQGNDPGEQDTVLSTLLALVRNHLAARFAHGAKHSTTLLLLLDEARRIRGFDGEEFASFVREARAGAVLVYQTLGQIPEDKRETLLDAVGTLVLLREVRGLSYELLAGMIGKGTRSVGGGSSTTQLGGRSITHQVSTQSVPKLEPEALAPFPFGPYSALVLVRDHSHGLPVFTDMTEPVASGPSPPSPRRPR